jgi:hypothetical protein
LVNGITIAEQDAYLDYCVSDFCSILRLQIAHVRTSCPLGTLISSIFCRDRDCDCDVSQAATFRPHCRNKQILPNLLLKFVGPPTQSCFRLSLCAGLGPGPVSPGRLLPPPVCLFHAIVSHSSVKIRREKRFTTRVPGSWIFLRVSKVLSYADKLSLPTFCTCTYRNR